MHDDKNSTTRDDSPIFESWNSWYLLVVLVNVIIVALIYLIFTSI